MRRIHKTGLRSNEQLMIVCILYDLKSIHSYQEKHEKHEKSYTVGTVPKSSRRIAKKKQN